jgi:hypothetical protein
MAVMAALASAIHAFLDHAVIPYALGSGMGLS